MDPDIQRFLACCDVLSIQAGFGNSEKWLDSIIARLTSDVKGIEQICTIGDEGAGCSMSNRQPGSDAAVSNEHPSIPTKVLGLERQKLQADINARLEDLRLSSEKDQTEPPDLPTAADLITNNAYVAANRKNQLLYVPDDDPCQYPEDDLAADQTACIEDMIDKQNLSEEEYKQARALLEHYSDCFAWKPSDLGECCVPGAYHHINVGNATTVKKSYYRMPYKKYEELRKHIANMLELGVIRPCPLSPWSSPVHLVPKPNGDTRLVCDMRGVNSVTIKDSYPLPLINDILANLGPARFLSHSDAYSGFWQIPIHPESIPITCISTPFGTFEWTRMCYGLANAPSTFARIINSVLRPCLDARHTYCYLDDIITHSATFAAHITDLEAMFQCMRSANLKLNPAKCRYFKPEITTLGHVIDSQGLKPDPKLLSAIKERKPPRNLTEVASFLGLCGYFRRFVKDYSLIAEPLSRLLRKNQTFQWEEEQEQAFLKLQDSLIHYPVLRRPDWTKPFTVLCDASRTHVAAILSQEDENNKPYVVAYHSRKLTPTMSRVWSTSELECYAVVNAVCEHWRDFLLGHEPGFSIVTDNVSLLWLLTCRTLTGKLARFSLKLQEFMPHFEIKHRRGKLNQAADSLSRADRWDDPQYIEDDAPLVRKFPEFTGGEQPLLDQAITTTSSADPLGLHVSAPYWALWVMRQDMMSFISWTPPGSPALWCCNTNPQPPTCSY